MSHSSLAGPKALSSSRTVLCRIQGYSASWLSEGLFQRHIMPHGCPELRPASANQPLERLWSAMSGLVST